MVAHLDSSHSIRDTSLPRDLHEHPWLRGRVFFTLPLRLWGALGAQEVDRTIAPEELALELLLAEACGADEGRVGFQNGLPIHCHLLCRGEFVAPEGPLLQSLGWNLHRVQLGRLIAEANRAANSRSLVARAYAGWLLQNDSFRRERDRLFGAGHVSGDGLDFCRRWRLQGFAAPTLPLPLEPFIGAALPSFLEELHQPVSVITAWPDTSPPPSEDERRRLRALANRPGNDHLADWQRIVGAANPSRNRLATLARQFELLHYWTTLVRRHSVAATGTLGRLEESFAAFFGVSRATIHADRLELGSRLGADGEV